MKITVDASVVVKWFAAEARHAEARLVLEDGIERHAPDLVLIESAQVLWRKSRNGEIADPTTLIERLIRSRVLRLQPSVGLLLDAVDIAEEVGHPVYDCLYIACARHAGTALVTDDGQLADVVAEHFPAIRALRLRDAAAIRRIQAAASPLCLEEVRLKELIEAVARLDATVQSVFDAWLSATWGVRKPTDDERALIDDSVPLRELLRLVDRLTEEERADLLALGWLGRGARGAESWDALLIDASQTAPSYDSRQIAALCHYWAAGRDLLAARKTRTFAAEQQRPTALL